VGAHQERVPERSVKKVPVSSNSCVGLAWRARPWCRHCLEHLEGHEAVFGAHQFRGPEHRPRWCRSPGRDGSGLLAEIAPLSSSSCAGSAWRARPAYYSSRRSAKGQAPCHCSRSLGGWRAIRCGLRHRRSHRRRRRLGSNELGNFTAPRSICPLLP
jgi:hypothetical protein